MANDQFERVMRFAQRTGDRLIVTDPEGREPLVILSLDEYEALVEGALGPGGGLFADDAGGEDEYGEAPTLEILDDAPSVAVTDRGRGAAADQALPAAVSPAAEPVVRQEKTPSIPSRNDPSEEQFYLEPL